MPSREDNVAPGWGRHPAPTLAEILRWRAEREPDRPAFTYLPDSGGVETRHTYASLERRSRAIASALRRRLPPGERAVLLYPPGLEFVEAFFACLQAGVVAVPAYPPRNRGHLPRLRAVVADSGARVALTVGRTAEAIRAQVAGQAEWASLELLLTDEVGEAEPAEAGGAGPDAADLAFLQYTSGSTGSPKGVMVTQRNLCYGAHYIRTEAAADGNAVSVCWLPSFHDMGLVDGVVMPVYAGCHGVLLSPVSFVQRPACWLEAITRFRGTHGGAPNFGYELCVRKIPPEARREFDLSSWTSAYNGAEPLRAGTLRAFAEAFAPCGLRPQTLYPTYGLAEATLMVTGGALDEEPIVRRAQRTALAAGHWTAPDRATPPEDAAELVSSGHTILETRVAVVSPEGRRCPAGVVGEVWIAGPAVCAGYWRRPAETAETFQARLAGEAGAWLRTGDLAFQDEAGELFICGRAKDLIIIRARNHYPQDIEETAGRAHAALRGGGAAAFAIEDEGEERLVVAHEVERAELRKLNVAVVGAAIARAIAEEHGVTPSAVVLLKPGGVPKTSSGKVQRGETRSRHLAGTLEAVGEWRPGAEAFRAASAEAGRKEPPAPEGGSAALAAWLAEALGRRVGLRSDEIDLHTGFSAYGLDSAAHIELAGELEARLGRPVPPMLLFDYPDIARLSAHLAGAPAAHSAAPAVAAGRPPGGSNGDAVAVIGLGLRLPGGADSPEAFWRLLREGTDAITEVPAERWDSESVYHPEPATPGMTNSRHGGFVAAIDCFDADFFGISPREAAALDPQQRLLLETAWHALEDAGLDPSSLAGTETGVFVGISTQDYARRTMPASSPERIEAHSGTGSALSAAAGRLAYFFDLRGPAIATDTACSSALVAVHQACRALLDGDCSLALAGGVNAILGPELAINFAQARMLAPDGRCKAFDAAADGYVRSEGCGVAVLKRLSAALADGDSVLAVIRGSAVGQDGRSNGLTAPNGPAQERVIRAALSRAGVPAAAVSYVEAHGTGTALGDPIEIRALDAVYGDRSPGAPLWVGSVKTNLGHLEAAAGIASLAKVVLALRQGELPCNLHFLRPSPQIPWDRLALRVVSRRMAWPAAGDGAPRRAGVSAFGFAGTNAHVIVEEAPSPSPSPSARGPAGPYLLPLSGRTDAAVRQLAEAWAGWLEVHPAAPLDDLCATAAESRASLPRRLLASGTSRDELIVSLREERAGAAPPHAEGAAFLFTGQGSATGRSGAELYASEPVFRASLERSAAVLDPLLPLPLLAVIRDGAGGGWEKTAFAQPALFALEWALVELLAAWGILPAAVLGHSVGEYVAAAAAGVFSAEDGLRLVAARGRLMQALPAGGGMLAVRAGEAAALEATAGFAGVVLAAENGPDETVLAGPRGELEKAAAALAARGISAVPLAVAHAFHTQAMAPIVEEFDRVLAAVRFSAPRVPLISTLGAETNPASPAHWRAHALEPVRFGAAFRRLAARGAMFYVEVGPRPVLTGLARTLGVPAGRCVPTLRAGRDERAALRRAAGEAWRAGANVAWRALRAPGARRRSGWGLPGYPFARERHWLELPEAGRPAGTPRANPTLAGWTARASPRRMAFGIMFFNGRGGGAEGDPYRFLCDAARFADARGFSSVWVPERHYTEFGGLYPNPSVVAAALARSTRSVRLMAGSLVAPLHHPLRIAEDWAVVDALSGGRAGLSFAAGWNPDDFASHPEAYAERHEAVFRAIEEVRRLWRGDAREGVGGTGLPARVRIYPRPVQPELPVWVTAAGNPRTFERAGEAGANVLTHLLDQPPAQLAEKIARYRAARARAGHDPDTGRVSVMVHTFLGDDDAAVRTAIGPPYRSFLKSNLHLLQGLAQSRGEAAGAAAMSEADREEFVSFLFERFYAERALFGRPEAVEGLVETLGGAGVNEIACLLDFGAPMSAALAALPHLDRLRRRFADGAAEVATARPAPRAGPPRPGPAPAYRIAWRELPAEPPPASRLEGVWLVLDEGAGFGLRVAAALAERGARPVLVEMGQNLAELAPGRFQAHPLSPDDFHGLLARLPEPPRGAVHLWSLDVGHAAAVTVDSVRAGLLAGVASLLHLAQALDRAGAPARIWLATRGALGGAGGEAPAAVAQAPAWGLARVLALEHSELWGGAVDLDPAPEAGEADRLADECARPEPEDQSARRGGKRVVPRLIPDAPAEFSPVAARPDASYLITGGLGGLGRRLARWLVERGARHLVLTGLHPLPPRAAWDRLPPETDELTRAKLEAVAALERAGARVRVEAADACDAARMAELVAGIDPPLAGVFHLAGLPENRPARETVFAEHSGVLGPKTTGAWILHELTRGLRLDWWVAFSSISAVWGSRGQPLYAAANTFLDALGQHRRALGLPATIVNWGPWAEGGMVVSIADQEQLARLGLRTTPPAEGIAALERLIALGRPQATVATVDWRLFCDLFASRGRSRLFAELAEAAAGPALETTAFYRELAALPAPRRTERITRWLQEAIARTLRWPEGRVPEPDRGFFDLGMDSLLAIEVKNRLQAELGVPLRATVAFNYPNVAALTEHLAGLLPSAAATGAAGLEDAELAALLERESRAVLEGGAS